MKKLIAVLAIVCLISGVAFAQIGATIHGGAFLMANDGDDIVAGGSMSRVRLDGSGESEDGKYGGYLRAQADDFWGFAWWKPIDQFMIRIGSNGGDNFWGKEGVTGWGFYQVAGDVGVAQAGNVWGGGYLYYADSDPAVKYRDIFFGGWDNGIMLEIKPIDILAINIGLPFAKSGAEVADFYQASTLQIDVNLDFGNIALTVEGLNDKAKIYFYFGLGAIENLSLDVGFSYDLGTELAAAGLGAKYSFSDSFALKFRAAASFGSKKTAYEKVGLLVDAMPIIGISDAMTAFVSLGLSMYDDQMNFHFNPYLQIGEEWGPSFWVGFQLFSTNNMKDMNWGIPIGINFSF